MEKICDYEGGNATHKTTAVKNNESIKPLERDI